MDQAIQSALAEAYPGGVGTIDLFEGGLAEHHVPGSDVGPTFHMIMVDQFERLRDGDRFFYLNQSFNTEEMNLLQTGNTLAEVITANTEITNLQANVMVFRAQITGAVSTKSITRTGTQITGASGVTVQLRNAQGDVVATTRTEQRGQFSFNQLSGPAASPTITPGVSAIGIYSVSLVLPRGTKQVTANPGGILISRGGRHVNGVNFVLASMHDAPSGPRRR